MIILRCGCGLSDRHVLQLKVQPVVGDANPLLAQKKWKSRSVWWVGAVVEPSASLKLRLGSKNQAILKSRNDVFFPPGISLEHLFGYLRSSLPFSSSVPLQVNFPALMLSLSIQHAFAQTLVPWGTPNTLV